MTARRPDHRGATAAGDIGVSGTPRTHLIGLVLALTLAFVEGAEAQQQLELANGDRLTGALVSVDGGAWVFGHAGGQLRIAAAEVSSFATSNPIGVRLVDGTILAAAVSTAGGRLQLSRTGGSTLTVTPADIAAVGDPADLATLEPLEIGYFSPLSRFWRATTSFGFSNKSGNSRSRGQVATLDVGRVSPKDRLALKLGMARQEADAGTGTLEETVEKYYGSLRADLFASPRLFFFGSTAQARDRFQDIDLRSNYDAGLGVQLIATPATDLRFYASGGLRREAFTSGGSTSTATVGAGLGLTQQAGPAVLAWAIDWSPQRRRRQGLPAGVGRERDYDRVQRIGLPRGRAERDQQSARALVSRSTTCFSPRR